MRVIGGRALCGMVPTWHPPDRKMVKLIEMVPLVPLGASDKDRNVRRDVVRKSGGLFARNSAPEFAFNDVRVVAGEHEPAVLNRSGG